MSDLDRKILLNPGPGTTSTSVKKALLVNDICPREREFGELLKNITAGILEIGNSTDKEYAVSLFAASGTGAVEGMLTSAIGKNQKVLVITNGSYGFRISAICKAYNLQHETMCEFGEYPDVNKLSKKLKEGNYSHLAMIHHETSTGMMNPLEEISKVCKNHNVKLMVDAISTFGGYPIDLENSGIHYLAASSNKCIHGMAGLSFVIFHNSCKSELSKNTRNFYFNLYDQWKNLIVKGQTRFTPPVQVCYSFKQAIDETLNETVASRWQRYQKNWGILYNGLKELGFKFYLPMEHQSKILMTIKLDGELLKGFEHFHDYLFDRNITVYPGVIPETNTFRVAVIGDLEPKDLEYVLEVMKEYFS